ncbi:MAG: hypothetical protein WD361_09600 [Gracilimonas sp.]
MMRTRPLLISLLILIFPVLALAQSGRGDADGSLLPEINPQDIEIRSEFQARFPGLRRQPILGFNPTPRVYQIDPNRLPFMETPEDAVADVSVTELGRPEPPKRTILAIPDRINAYIRAGFGSFLTPEINGYGYYELNEKSFLTANLNLSGSDGHLDYQESSFTFMDFDVKYYQKNTDKWRFMLEAGALSDQHYLFNTDGLNETPEKKNLGASAKATIKKVDNVFQGFEASLGGSIFESNLTINRPSIIYPITGGEVSEKTYFANTMVFWPGSRLYETFKISGQLDGGFYDNLTDDQQQWLDANAAIQYERLLNFTTRVSAKGGLEYISDPFSEKFYLVPEVEIKHNLSHALSVSGNAFAKPEMQTIQDHHQFNRFLNIQTPLRHAYKIGAAGEVNYQLFEGNRFFGGLNYQHIKDYAYYQRRIVTPGNIQSFYDVNYANANILEFYVGAIYQLVPDKFWADAKIYARSPKLAAGGNIPYEEKIGVETAVSFKPLKELTINGWTEYIGSRESPETSSDLNAFFLLNAGAEYQINDTFGVYAKLLNILGQDYEIWSGYQERPFQIFGGVTIKF